MRKIIRASLLMLALSYPAYAGHIPNNGPEPPAPQPTPMTSITTQETADGYIPNNEPAESTLTEAVFSLVQSVLSLF
jgi:hypothetical protein